MNRRDILAFLTALPLAWKILPARAQAITSGVIADLEARRRTGRGASAAWVAEQLKKIPADQRLVAAYAVVQSIPYRLTRWTGDPDSLFLLGRGDCRHKAFGQMRLFRALGARVRHVKMRFDWADLPIPDSILANLNETRGVHDSVAIESDNGWTIIDATWNPPLARRGFPVTSDWNGHSPTVPLTAGKLVPVFFDELPEDTNLYEYLSVPWPDRARTQAFNRALNRWLNQPDLNGI